MSADGQRLYERTQSGEVVFYVVSAARLFGGSRHVYAVGNQVSHSGTAARPGRPIRRP